MLLVAIKKLPNPPFISAKFKRDLIHVVHVKNLSLPLSSGLMGFYISVLSAGIFSGHVQSASCPWGR